jgi:hypothetical protein
MRKQVVKLPPKKLLKSQKGGFNDHPRQAYQKEAQIARAGRVSQERV